jgi:hypothetical protein
MVTTDISLERLSNETALRPKERFVVREAAAFSSEPRRRAVVQLPIIPWLSIDDPNRVP